MKIQNVEPQKLPGAVCYGDFYTLETESKSACQCMEGFTLFCVPFHWGHMPFHLVCDAYLTYQDLLFLQL